MFQKVLTSWIGIFVCLPFFLFAQHPQRCNHDQKMEEAFQLDPAYQKAIESEVFHTDKIESSSSVIIIPVHVIIVHPPGQAIGSGVNFSMAHIQSQIDVLNEDFRRLNADATNTPSVFPADDSMIEFCLASIDPSGNPTNGVTRYGTNQNLDNNENAIKSATGWDRNTYMNFWVGDGLGGLLGWAYLPSTTNLPNATLDGIVVASCTFGGPGFGTCTPYALGRTATHEVGHYLGLRHVWGNSGCNNDDGIADTPVQDNQNFGCPNHPSPSCNNGGDMFMNYMDYVNDNCMNSFTTGQGTRMQNILNTSRSSLLTAANTVCSASSIPLTIALLNQTNVLCNNGNTGTVSVQASGGGGNFTYTLNGGTPQSSNTFTNLSAGVYTIDASDGSNSISLQVTVTEPPILVPLILTQQGIACFGDNNGILTAGGTGGTNLIGSGFQYSFNGSPFSPNNIFANISPGVYNLIVQDDNNCQSNTLVIFSEPDPLVSFVDDETPIDCAGNSNGQVVIQSTGGTPAYLYSLNSSPANNNNVFSNLSAGNYQLNTVDVNGCETQLAFTMTEPSPLDLSVNNQTNIDCFGDNDGMIEVTAQGGTTNYEYQIDNGGFQNSPVFNGLAAGTYMVEVKDANGCTKDITADIISPPEITTSISQQTNVDCFGGNTGSVTIQSSGGVGDLSVTFNGNTMVGGSVTFDNLTAGVYPFFVTDDNNCTVNSTIQIMENSNVELLLQNNQNVNCNGASNGQIQVQTNGGTGNFTYFLNNVNQGNNNTFTNLSGGTYVVESVDDLGCSDMLTVQVSEPTAINAQVFQQTNISCFGNNNGSVEVNASGGTGTIQFTVGNVTNTTGVFDNLSAGTYNVAIIDANGCLENISVQITSPTELTSSVIQQSNVGCFGGNTGSVTIQSSGGTGNVSVSFNGNTMVGNSVVFDNLAAGVYPIVVTDENNCTVNSSVEITQNPNVELLLQNNQNVNCNGASNGEIEVQTNGGTGNFTYFLNNVNQGNNNTFTNLSGGTYTIESVDGLGCSDILTVEITEPSVLNTQLVQQTNLDCFGTNNGSVEISASGGTGAIQFTLGNQTNTTGVFNNLSAGNYSVNVVDENNCSTTVDVEVTEPSELIAQVANANDVDCFGNNSGSIEITATGGAQNYQFSNGTTTNSTGVFDNLIAGNYVITITDGNNCETTIQTVLTQPFELTANISTQQNVNCFGGNAGSVTLQANGGVGSITFTLNGNTNTSGSFSNLTGGSYNIIVADANNCETSVQVDIDEPTQLNLAIQTVTEASCAGQEGTVQVAANGGASNYQYILGSTTNSTGFFEGLSGGIYMVEVIDGNGCMDEVQVEIIEPSALSASISQVQNINCFGGNTGSVQLNAVGGIGDLTYTLGNQSNATGFFQNLNAGNYMVEVEDANSCSSTIEVTISQPNELEIEATQIMQIDCYGGSDGMVNLASIGGTGTIEFILGNQTNTSGIFENLTAGNYTFSSVDGNGCTDELEIEITEPTEISTDIQSTQNPSCNGDANGMLEVVAIGGSGNLTYTLGTETNTTGTFQNIAAGNYSLLVTDENNCVSEQVVEFIEPSAIVFQTPNMQNIDCNGQATGMIQAIANGGTGDLTFTLDNQTNSTGLFENLNAGIYEVMVMDENNCSTVSEIEVEETTAISFDVFDIQDANCFGENTGLISIGASGGTGNFEYTLGNQNNTTGDFSNLVAGSYSILITDDNNCFTNLDFTINQPAPIVPTITISSPIACFGDLGIVQLTAEGGIGNYVFSQNTNTNTSGIFENLTAGMYEFMIEDGNGCQEMIQLELTQPSEISLEILNTTPVPCNGNPTGVATVQATNGAGGFIYEMNNQTNTSGVFENLTSGIYDLSATDANGCISETTVTIEELNDIAIETAWSENIDCFGDNDGIINITALSASGNLTFELNGNQNTTGVFENLASGSYAVTLTDINGCMEILPFEISEPDALELEVLGVTNVDCFGNSNGVTNLNAIGGTGNLTYTLNGNSNSTGVFENLPAGNYTAEVVDDNGCLQSEPIQIVQPDAIETEIINLTGADCFGTSTGAIHMNAVGGAGNFTYTLNGNSNSTGIFGNLPAGNYSMQIEDADGCINTQSFQISEPSELEILVSDISNDLGNGDGTVTLDGNGGLMPFMYSLDGANFQSGNSFENLVAGDYTGFIQDGNGCISQTMFTIEMETSIFSPNSGVTDLNILPNPFSENLFLKIDLEKTQGFQLRMWTVSGKAVYQKTIHLQKGKQQVNLDVDNALAAGTYILQVQNEIGELAYFKLVKQR